MELPPVPGLRRPFVLHTAALTRRGSSSSGAPTPPLPPQPSTGRSARPDPPRGWQRRPQPQANCCWQSQSDPRLVFLALQVEGSTFSHKSYFWEIKHEKGSGGYQLGSLRCQLTLSRLFTIPPSPGGELREAGMPSPQTEGWEDA